MATWLLRLAAILNEDTELVGAAVAEQPVGADVTDERVGEVRAGQPLDTEQCVSARSGRAVGDETRRDGVGGRAVTGDVHAGPAVDTVFAATAFDDVVTCAALDVVGGAIATQPVVER